MRAGPIAVEPVSDPAELLIRTMALLKTRQVANNLLASVLERRVGDRLAGHYWIATRDGRCCGCAVQAPLQMRVLLPKVTPSVAVELAIAIARSSTHIPGVVADATTAATFAGQWSESSGAVVHPVEGQRIYRLRRLNQPSPGRGRLRPAAISDRHLLSTWFVGFMAETGALAENPVEEMLARELALGSIFVWDDGGPRAMARVSPAVLGLVRIGSVYTPPDCRRQGIASSLVGALCALIRSQYRAVPVLYTQLSNPAANRLYRRLGFRAETEVLSYNFVGEAPGSD